MAVDPDKPRLPALTREVQIYLDELMEPIYFQDLLETAAEVCLTAPISPPERVEPSGEAELIAMIGTRGIKAALELSEGALTISEEQRTVLDKGFETEYKRPIAPDSPMRIPERFGESIDTNILRQAEAFGAQLIDESFNVLGQDAFAKLKTYKNAKTADEQMQIINWLQDRLYKIAYDKPRDDLAAEDDPEEDPDKHFYHPARLSPKIIGKYPNINTPPTCLGISIIAASFFSRAGAEFLHADVSRTRDEHNASIAFLLVDSMRTTIADKYSINFPVTIKNSLDKMGLQSYKLVTREDAHHAALYVKLIDGTWAQFDSNFKSTMKMDRDETVEILDKNIRLLSELAPIAPGLEMISFLPGQMSWGETSLQILERQNEAIVTKLFLSAYLELQKEDPESFGQRVYDNCVKEFFNPDENDEEYLGLLKKAMLGQQVYTATDALEGQTQAAFYKMFNKFVLWGNDPSEVLSRASRDRNYLVNRVADIMALPFLIMASISRDEAAHASYDRGHAFVETGLPEQRIGLAVLSDFAQYTDSPLTASFWLSHWPGAVSVIENLDGASHSSHQDSLLYNNLIYRDLHPLTSRKNYGIINSFINSRTPPELEESTNEGEKDGKAQQG